MRLHVLDDGHLFDAGADHRHEAIVIHFHAELVQERQQLRRLRRRIEQEQNASLFVPKIPQQLHLAIGEIVLRPIDHDRFHLGRNGGHLEQIQFLKFYVLAFDHHLEDRDQSAFRERRFLVAEDVTENVFLALDEIHQRARDRLLAFESPDLWLLAEHRIALVDLRHLGGLDRFVAAVVLENDETFVADDFVFVDDFLGPGKIPVRIDNLDVHFPLRGILIFGEKGGDVRTDRVVRREENRRPHFAFDRLEETFRLIRERVFLVARKIPAAVVLEAEIVHHHDKEEQERDLHDDVQADAKAMDLRRLWGALSGCDVVSHFCWQKKLESPFPGLERLVSQHQHHDGHAEIKDHRTRIDFTARERAHLFDRREITQHL